MLTDKTVFYTCIVLLISNSVLGQTTQTTFSSFGIGSQNNVALTHQQAMGGVGVSTPDYFHLNVLNPALLPYNTITVLEAGIVGEYRSFRQEQGTLGESTGFNFNYIGIGFPIIRNWWSTGIRLNPYSLVNYAFSYDQQVESSEQLVEINETGSGGLNEFSWSHGVALHRVVSVGVKASYLFGSIVNRNEASLKDSEQFIQYVVNVHDRQFFTGFGFKAGVLIHFDSLFSKKKHHLNVGFTYDIQSDVDTRFLRRFERTNGISVLDSAVLVDNVVGKTIVPQTFAVGLSIGKKQEWTASFDFTYRDRANYRNFSGENLTIQDSWKTAMGFRYTPATRSDNNYFKRITYRLGFAIEKSSYLFSGKPLNDYGFTFGLSCPVENFSSVSLAMKIGRQGELAQNNIEENYVKIYLGITFNDRWFVKRKFN